MPFGLAVIRQRNTKGRKHSNVHAIKELRNGTSAGAMDEAFFDAFQGNRVGHGEPIAAIMASPSPMGERSPLERILLLHYLLQGSANIVLDCYLSDGSTPGVPVGGSDITTLNFTCAGNITPGLPITEDNTAGLTSALLMDKEPAQRGIRHGFLWLKNAVIAGDVLSGADDGLQFRTEAVADVYRQRVNNALATSGVAVMMSGGASISHNGVNRVWVYGQARYYTKAQVALNPALEGALASVVTVTEMTLKDVQSRQVKKGKRRKETAVQVAQKAAAMGLTVNIEQAKALDANKVKTNTGIIPPWDPNADLPGNIDLGGGGNQLPEPAP